MKTAPKVLKIERVDDIPLLLAQMKKVGIASLLDRHFPVHGSWQGPSLGVVGTVWLSHILSEGDHRLSTVQGWAGERLATLGACLQAPDLSEIDFSDVRLAQALDYLGKDDAAWESYVYAQNATLLRVYDLKAQRVRIDSTTVKSYVGVEPDGLFQFGDSKQHRLDLVQLKINMATLDPLGLPLSTTIVSGECADDPLYVPEIRKVQACLGYQEEYIIERGFNRLRGKTLDMTPLYLSSTTRIKGLIRLLCIGLRVLSIVEFTVREALRERHEKLAGIYPGNPKRSTARPTTEMMLRVFTGINNVGVSLGETSWHSVTPLNAVQTRILEWLGLPMTVYQSLSRQSEELACEISEP